MCVEQYILKYLDSWWSSLFSLLFEVLIFLIRGQKRNTQQLAVCIILTTARPHYTYCPVLYYFWNLASGFRLVITFGFFWDIRNNPTSIIYPGVNTIQWPVFCLRRIKSITNNDLRPFIYQREVS